MKWVSLSNDLTVVLTFCHYLQKFSLYPTLFTSLYQRWLMQHDKMTVRALLLTSQLHHSWMLITALGSQLVEEGLVFCLHCCRHLWSYRFYEIAEKVMNFRCKGYFTGHCYWSVVWDICDSFDCLRAMSNIMSH